MALSVQTNNAAITALKNLNINSANMNKSLNRLSTGFRINSASDDASGFAISSKLDAQTMRLKAASQNATQATAMVKTADAGINEIQNMVNRIQTLAVQASSANNAAELSKLDAERLKLESAINKIAQGTNYNGTNLLDGTGAAGNGGSTLKLTGTYSASTGTSNLVSVVNVQLVSGTSNAIDTTSGYTISSDNNGNILIKDQASAGASTSNTIGTGTFTANGSQNITLTDGNVIKVTYGAVKMTTTTQTATFKLTGAQTYAAVATTAPQGNSAAFTIDTISNSKVTEAVYSINEVSTVGGSSIITIVNDKTSTTVGTTSFTTGVVKTTALTLSDGNSLQIAYDGSTLKAAGQVAVSATVSDFSAVGNGTSAINMTNIVVNGTTGITKITGSFASVGATFTLNSTKATSSFSLTSTNGETFVAQSTGNATLAVANGASVVWVGSQGTKISMSTASTAVLFNTVANYTTTFTSTDTTGKIASASKVGDLTTGVSANTATGAAAGSATFQVGADNNANNQVTVNLGNSYKTVDLGLGTGDLLSASNAKAYIDTAKTALNTLITQRADLGATQNQLGFLQANLATSIEQTISAVSSIRDADMAAEMANFTKNKILTQAGTSMLAQANQAAQNILTLFR